MSGGYLFEVFLMLKLMIEKKYKIKNVILEVDLNFFNDKKLEGVLVKFLFYIYNFEIIKVYFVLQDNFNEFFYILFYRYIKFDFKIGFREIYKIVKNEKNNFLDNLGYYLLEKYKNGNMKNNIVKLNFLFYNKYYEEIKNVCKVNNINFIVVMILMCENVKGMNYFEKVKKVYLEIYNYENIVVEDKYFFLCGYMIDVGVRIFIVRILNDFFKK